MKQLWLRINSEASKAEKIDLLKAAEENCDVVILEPEDLPLTSKLKLRTACRNGKCQIKLFKAEALTGQTPDQNSAVEIQVKSSRDEERALQLLQLGFGNVIVHCPNWKIIPLENLISRTRGKASLLAEVADVKEAKTALEILELGVDGIVLPVRRVEEIEELKRFLTEAENVTLQMAKVSSVRALGSGVRVCVDTCELMGPGEGILVGSQSAGLFLVEAEVHRNPHVEPRPFRVNAGPVSSYVLTPGFKTRYLSELKAGDEIFIVNRHGRTKLAHVGRVKIERRPMKIIESEVDGRSFSIIVQNAETVRLITRDGSKPITEIKPGDGLLIRIEEGGRHFGTLVKEETVIER